MGKLGPPYTAASVVNNVFRNYEHRWVYDYEEFVAVASKAGAPIDRPGMRHAHIAVPLWRSWLPQPAEVLCLGAPRLVGIPAAAVQRSTRMGTDLPKAFYDAVRAAEEVRVPRRARTSGQRTDSPSDAPSQRSP